MKLSTVAVNCRLLLSAPRLGPFTHSDPFGPWLEARLPLIVGVVNNENRRPTASFSLDDGGSGSRFFDGNGFLSEDRGGNGKPPLVSRLATVTRSMSDVVNGRV
jgi:hypothetical protein